MKNVRLIASVVALFSLVAALEVQGAEVLTVQGNNVGINTTNPLVPLHIVKTAVGNATMFQVENAGAATFELRNTALGAFWFFQADQDGTFKFSRTGTGGSEIIVRRRLDQDGPTLFVDGSVKATNVVYSSSRDEKSDFSSVDNSKILDKLVDLPIEGWRYQHEGEKVRHIGPMAEDFYASFGLGSTDHGISAADVSGVALAAIQALNAKIAERDQRLAELERETAELKALVLTMIDKH